MILSEINAAACRLYVADQTSDPRGQDEAARRWRDGRVSEIVRAKYRRTILAAAAALADVDVDPADLIAAVEEVAKAVDDAAGPAYEPATRLPGVFWYRRPDGTAYVDTARASFPDGQLMYVAAGGAS